MSSSEGEEPFQFAQPPQDQIDVTESSVDSSTSASLEPSHFEDNATAELSFPASAPAPTIDPAPLKQEVQDPEDAEASSDEQSTVSDPRASRPNRFTGPPSTWRNWTAPERDLAASLDQLTAKNLSIHLFNTFMLKKMNVLGYQLRENSTPDVNQDGFDGTATWMPPKAWTAWPLSPEDVPREEEGKRWEETTTPCKNLSVSKARSGEVLRELLVAQILRKGRGRFNDREPESYAEEPTVRAAGTESLSADAGGSPGGNPGARRPVVLADDERAKQVLQPTVQHVMTRLDELLMGLHHPRSSYVMTDNASCESDCQSNKRSTSGRKTNKRKRNASTHETDSGIDYSDTSAAFETETSSSHNSKSRSRGHSKRPKSTSRKPTGQNRRDRISRMGCRDWSDVLGIASMTNWPSTVVEAAAARCAALFGEGITFRTLEEGKPAFLERTYVPDVPSPHTVTRGHSTVVRVKDIGVGYDENEMVGGVHSDGFLHLIEGKKSWKYSNNGPKKRSTRESGF